MKMPRIYAVSDRTFPDAIPTAEGYDIVIYPSDSDPDKAYRVDVTFGRCNCPAWTYQKNPGGGRRPCKHLQRLGFKQLIAGKPVDINEPPKLKAGQKAKVTA
jgi:hypothetical protein